MRNFLKRSFSTFVMICFLIAQILPNSLLRARAADGERYLAGFEENITVDDSSYMTYDTSFYNTIKTNYSSSYNSEDTALEISTAGEFAAFSQVVNEGHNFSGKFVKLTSDINLNGGGVTFTEQSDGTNFKVVVSGTPRNRWKPIGNSSRRDFRGTFDGGGHEIKNMVVFEKSSDSGGNAGLFGSVSDGTIKNVGIGSGSNVCVFNFSNYIHVGGVAGSTTGSLVNCYSMANVYINSYYSYTGGLVGEYYSITNCYANGNIYGISGNFIAAGGLCGLPVGPGVAVSNCYATGDVYAFSPNDCGAGGLRGNNGSTATNCYRNSGAMVYAKQGESDGAINIADTTTDIANLKGDVTKTITGFNDDNVWIFTEDQYPKLKRALNDEYSLEITKSGDTLTANTTQKPGATQGIVPTYSWKCGEESVGSNSNTYTLTNDDYGNTFSVTVTSSNHFGEITASLEVPLRTSEFTVTWPEFTYNGSAPEPIIVNDSSGQEITHSYKASGSSTYTDGIPTIPGIYDMKSVQAAGNGYAEKTYNSTLTIKKRPLTVSANKTFEKTYNGGTDLSVSADDFTLSGTVGNDDVSISSINVQLSDKNVGDWNIQLSSCILNGAQSSFYSVPSVNTVVGSCTVNKKPLTLEVKMKNKPYNGKNDAQYESGYPKISVVVSGDDVSVTVPTATFSDPNVDSNKIINFSADFVLQGNDAGNYSIEQPAEVKANITEGFEPILNTHYTIDEPTGENGWYTKDFYIKAENGYKISYANSDTGAWLDTLEINEEAKNKEITFYVRNTGDASHEISQAATFTYSLNKINPSGTITIKDNPFKTLLNAITFGMFFKDSVDVEISSDNSEYLSKIEYCLSDNVVESPENISNWTDYASKFSVNANKKLTIYAKITNLSGRSVIINSDGVVVYTDSTVETNSITYTKYSNTSKTINLTLNGNTVDKIVCDSGETPLAMGTDYSSNDTDGSIVLTTGFLDGLSAGSHSLSIYFNPMGVTYNPKSGYTSDEAPAVHNVALTIKKANQTITEITGLKNSYTYGDSTILGVEKSYPGTVEPTGDVSYSSLEKDVVKINGNTLSIVGVGTFSITATIAEDDNYNGVQLVKNEILVQPKSVSITGVTSDNKIYDGTAEAALITDSAKLEGVLDSDADNVEIDKTSAKATFDSKTVGENKTVMFSGFELGGEKAANYVLNSQPNSDSRNISKKNVTIVGTTVRDKTYDGNFVATIENSGELEGVISVEGIKDDVSIANGIAMFYKNDTMDKNVGNDKLVKFSLFKLTGTDAANYNLEAQPADSTANITQADLKINLKVSDKQYDGLNTATYEEKPTLITVFNDDDVALNEVTPSFSSVDVKRSIEIKFEKDFEISGDDAQNYNLIQPGVITADIYNDFSPETGNAESGKEYSLSEVDGKNDWYSQNDFEIIANHGYLVSEDNKDDSDWKSKLTYSQETAGTEVSFYVRNESTKAISNIVKKSYKKDGTCPKCSIVIGENKFYGFMNRITFNLFFKDKFTATIEYSDDMSDVLSVQYYKSNTPISKEEIGSIENWNNGTAVNVNTEEELFIYAKVTDFAGNTTYADSDGIIVSQTPTAINLEPNFDISHWTSQTDAKLDISVKNNVSVIKSVDYQVGNEGAISVEVQDKKNVNFSIENLPDGEYDVTITTVDKLENTTKKAVQIKKDTVAPIIRSVDLSEEHWTKNNVVLTVNADDECSGLNENAYSFDGGSTWQSENKFVYGENQVVAPNTIQVKDNSGNTSAYGEEVTISIIDKTPPKNL